MVAEFDGVELDERSIDDDVALRDRYAEEIPVVLIDGAVHTYWRVDPDRLRAALTAVGRTSGAGIEGLAGE